MTTESPHSEQQSAKRKERILQAYYERLNAIDESNRDFTNFFFAINAAILAVVFRVAQENWQQLALSFVGYTASVALVLITYKSFWAWKAYFKDMKPLEDDLGYGISEKYKLQLKDTQAEAVKATLIRMRFNALFILLWLIVIIYLVRTIPAPWPLEPSWISIPLGSLLIAVVICFPWMFFAGKSWLRVASAALRALWAPEV